jgi:hypothetical protein
MSLDGADRATLRPSGMLVYKLRRLPPGTKMILATSLRHQVYPPEIIQVRERIEAMVNREQDARLFYDNARAYVMDDQNRAEVLRIFEKYGWPKWSLFGKDATHQYWLLVQHQTTEIERRMLPEMEKAKSGEASMADYALRSSAKGRGQAAALGRPDGLQERQAVLSIRLTTPPASTSAGGSC